MRRLLILILAISLLLPVATYAQTTVPAGGTGITSVPAGAIVVGSTALRLTSTTSPTVGVITATSTTATSTFPKINLTTAVTFLGEYITNFTNYVRSLFSFNASDFDVSGGSVTIDYTNGQAAASGVKGFLTAADWTTFSSKNGYGWPWTIIPQGVSTSTLTQYTNGIIAFASSTIQNLSVTNGTTTNATSTTLSTTIASTTNLFVSSLRNTLLGTDGTGKVIATSTTNVTGNASTATTLQTGRTINTVTFDGSQNITITAASSTALGDRNTWSALQQIAAASTTSLTASNFWLIGQSAGCAQFDSNAKLTSTGVNCGTGTGGSWPFIVTTYNGQAAQSTTTLLLLTASPISLAASSTFMTQASTTMLTNSGSTWLTLITNGLLSTDTTGKVVATTTPTALNYISTSQTATSSFSNAVTIGGPNSYLLVATGTPSFGQVSFDNIDAGGSYNGPITMTAYNDSASNCAQANIILAGNGANPTTGHFGLIGHTSQGYTGIGCPAGGPEPADSLHIFEASGSMLFNLGSTTGTTLPSFIWSTQLLGANAGERARLTSQGLFGIATATPSHLLTIATGTKPQIGLSDGTAASNIWTLRSVANSLFFATSTAQATSSVAAFSIGPDGRVTIAGLRGCDTVDTDGNGILSCGTDSTGSGGAWPFSIGTYAGQVTSASTTLLQLTGSPLSLAASSTFTTQASTTMLTSSGSTWLTGLTGPAPLAIDSTGKVYAAATTTAANPSASVGSASATNGTAITFMRSDSAPACTTATASVPGCLAAADFATFSAKLSWPWTVTSNYGTTTNATTTPTWYRSGFFASSTVYLTSASTTALSATSLSATNSTTTTFGLTGVSSALLLAGATGGITGYTPPAGCSNQFLTAITAVGGFTCASVTDSTFSGTLGTAHGGTNLDTHASTGVAVINAGVWSASTTLATYEGGTGLSTVGTPGQVLMISGNTGLPVWIASSSAATSLSGGTTGMLTAWLSASTVTATSGPTAAFFWATSTSIASFFPYASTTALTAGSLFSTNATTTNLAVTRLSSSLLYANPGGGVVGTSTLSWNNGGTGTSTATTNAVPYFNGSYFAGNPALLSFSGTSLGVGSSTPWAALSIVSNLNPSLVIATSTGLVATFAVENTGGIRTGAINPATSSATILDWSLTPPQVEFQLGSGAITITVINATTTTYWGSRKIVWVCNPTAAAAGALTWGGIEWIGTTPVQTTTAGVCDIYSFDITRATSTSAFKVAGTQGAGFK